MIPDEAVEAIKAKVAAFLGGPDLHIHDVPRFSSGLVDMILEAASPQMMAQAWDECAASDTAWINPYREAAK